MFGYAGSGVFCRPDPGEVKKKIVAGLKMNEIQTDCGGNSMRNIDDVQLSEQVPYVEIDGMCRYFQFFCNGATGIALC